MELIIALAKIFGFLIALAVTVIIIQKMDGCLLSVILLVLFVLGIAGSVYNNYDLMGYSLFPFVFILSIRFFITDDSGGSKGSGDIMDYFK